MTAAAPDTDTTTWTVGGALEIAFTTTFDWTYDDKGTGASACASFWHPNVSQLPDYWPLGSLGVNNNGNYGYNPSGDRAMVVVKDLSGQALAAPTGYTQVWNDHGSGGNNDGSVWKPVAPDGYVAMGLVFVTGYDQPSLDAVRCVAQGLVHRGSPGAQIWCDSGSGAHGDFSCWEVTAPPAAAGTLSLAPGTFCGAASYDQNAARAEPTTLYAFPVTVPEQPEPPAPAYPVLTSFSPPSTFAGGEATATSTLPWFAVADPDYAPLQSLVKSPTYRLERTDRWTLGDEPIYNKASGNMTRTLSVTEGVNGESATSFASETGIELGLEYGFSKLVKGSIKLSQKFTYTSTSTSGWSKETSKDLTYQVPPQTILALYVLNSEYALYRQDGSQVNTANAGYNVPGVIFATQYPDADPKLIDEATGQVRN